jgi:phosphoserine aminotransferase
MFITHQTILFSGHNMSSEPEVGNVPLVCDASSDILHIKIDVNKYGLGLCGAHKRILDHRE